MLQSKYNVTHKDSVLESLVRTYLKNPDGEILAEVVENSGRLISYFIRLYGCGQSREDLYQIAAEGVLKALHRYDPYSDTAFSTYAGHCIMGEIRHYVRKESSYYRPAAIGKLQEDIDNVIERELDETGQIPETSSIAEKINIREEGLKEVMRAGLVPLDAIDISKISSLRLESFRLPVEDRIVLQQALNMLTDLQRKVIHMLFYREMTQEQAAARLKINQRKVSRLLQSSLKILRSMI